MWAGAASSARAIVGCRKARRYLKSNTTDDDFRSGAHYSDVAVGLGGNLDATTRTGVATTLGIHAAILSKPLEHQRYLRTNKGVARSWGGVGYRPGSGDGGRLPWSWSSSQPASASEPRLGWSGRVVTEPVATLIRALLMPWMPRFGGRHRSRGWGRVDRPGSGDGGRPPPSSAPAWPASASETCLGRWGGTRSYFTATPGAPVKPSDKQGRRSELGGVGWGGVAQDPGPGARAIISQTSTKGRVVPARPTRRRPYAEQQ